MIKVCLFDLGGVVINTGFETVFNHYQQKRGWDIEKLREKIFSDKYELLLSGQLSLADFIDWIAGEVDLTKEQLEEFADDYYYSGQVKEEVERIIRQLKQNCQVGLVTNDIGYLQQKFDYLGLDGLFDQVINSFAVGYCKPSLEFYQAVVNQLEVPPAEILFIDDDQQSLQVAEEVGLSVLDFTGAFQLRQELKKLDLIE